MSNLSNLHIYFCIIKQVDTDLIHNLDNNLIIYSIIFIVSNLVFIPNNQIG